MQCVLYSSVICLRTQTHLREKYILQHLSASFDVSGVKNLKFKCESCDNNYTSEGNLKTHTLTKHQMMRFQSRQCDLNFSCADSLRGHITAVHQGQLFMRNQCDQSNDR